MKLEIVAPAPRPAPSRGPASGAAMDRPAARRRPPYGAFCLTLLLLAAGGAVVVHLTPRGLRVATSDIRIGTVTRGLLGNDVMVRATAEPLHTLVIDAIESGRVEEVLVEDGALVEKDAPLFRLSNPQLRLNLVGRAADRAQQISNLSTLRVSIETRATEHRRRMRDLSFALAQAEKEDARNASLAHTGVIAAVAVEQSQDRLTLQRVLLDDEKVRAEAEDHAQRSAVRQMEEALGRLDAALAVVSDSIDALAVRAPIAGRLTDFKLELGEMVRSEQRVGRIDDPRRFKLTAHVEEYYLNDVSAGKNGSATVNGRDYAVVVSRVLPQITEGRFSVELEFSGQSPPELKPGQSLDTRIAVGSARDAPTLPDGEFVDDTGGSWAYVVAADGRSAARRPIRLGHRNHGRVEVLSGLDDGERVVVSGYAGFGSAERLQLTR